jgi:hypothetical protein
MAAAFDSLLAKVKQIGVYKEDQSNVDLESEVTRITEAYAK